MGCVYIFTQRHIWSFKRCLERKYDLNDFTPWKAVDYWKYDVNMTVNIITKEDIKILND